ncbi:non-hydrolyzing UDP-N-acetylglucosamine 2-epimerase [Dermatobacter hominis]|uniref:non-hydrolyzing UDP-N-acetylglucosamine 2-epimerase n=1 Tax=Dermatobacter hominis TaxID=2884263 RepID=UPI001D103C15|nr:UDP-N-acetylglucosamine 2-epimerase (non-hydrolyzing) [Dermatobacter hominis]UDY34816.1 UDP-N-acetylglucosamine 2-epimerase (non-hydrolyzing) [Dermatobacter hominis]
MSTPQDRPVDGAEPVRGRATLPPGMLPPGVEHDRRTRARQPIQILLVIGTRPEAIKMLPLVLALREHPALHPVVVSTGQHRDLVDPILEAAGITPDVDLGCGGPGVTLNELVTSVASRFDAFCRERYGDPTGEVADLQHVVSDGYPGAVLVHGDTSSAMAAALSSFHLRLPVVHVEAGLRTYDALTPFPEEMNRQLISRIACFHLAPTPLNGEHLVREGVPYDRVYVCGNTGIDAMRWAASLEQEPTDPAVAAVAASGDPLMVVTAHRREHWDGGIDRIAAAIATLADRRPDTRFVVPMHPNPIVRRQIVPHLGDRPNVVLTEPMAYVEFAHLLARADLVVTDSGGIQEEAPVVGTPVLVAREETERTEGVEAGTLELVGTDPERIVHWSELLLDDTPERRAMLSAVNPYGDGHTAPRIADALCYLAGDDRIVPEHYGPGFERRAVMRAAGYRSLRHAAEEPAPERDEVPDRSDVNGHWVGV